MFGVSIGLLVQAHVGLPPWDVLHQGLANRLGLSIGTVVIVLGLFLLLLWIPLRQKPGVGTVANTILVGVSLNWTLTWMPAPDDLWIRLLMAVGGVVLNGIFTAAYIGARMGPGPRDGLMTGLTQRTGWSTRTVRTGIELVVLLVGWLLGGTLGVGTLLFAFGIGPVVHFMMPRLMIPAPVQPAQHRS
jgi:uncharacterized membrane protein YczE